MRGIFESDEEESESRDRGLASGDGEGEALSPERKQRALQLVSVVTNEGEAFQAFIRKMVRSAVAPREDLLNSSLLTLAVAALENLLALLVTEHLRRFPGMLEAEEKAFSLADLQAIGSIDDARTVLIERRVDSFMRKGVDDWSKWAGKTLGAGFDELCIDLDSVKEMFQRRHLVVHAGGIVNRMYLERAPLSRDMPELGSYLPTTADYVFRALDEFEVLGDLLLFSAWNKWMKEDDRETGRREFESRILELMAAKRWRVVQRLCERAVELDFPAVTHVVLKVNRWIAMKHLSRFDDECRREVEEWDTSALSTVFVMARAVLLDNEKEALGLLEATLAARELSRRDAETWPLFIDLRKSRKFSKALASGIEQAEAAENASESKLPSKAKKSPMQKARKGAAGRRSSSNGAASEKPKTPKKVSSSKRRSGSKTALGSGTNKRKS